MAKVKSVDAIEIEEKLAIKPISNLEVDFGRDDLNQLVAKINEIINRIN